MKQKKLPERWRNGIFVGSLTFISILFVFGIAYLIYISLWRSFTSTRTPLSFKYPSQLTPYVCVITPAAEDAGQVEYLRFGAECRNTNPGFGYVKVTKMGDSAAGSTGTEYKIGDTNGYKINDSDYVVFTNGLKYEFILGEPNYPVDMVTQKLFEKLFTTLKF